MEYLHRHGSLSGLLDSISPSMPMGYWAKAIADWSRTKALDDAANLCDSFDERECCSSYCARKIRELAEDV